MPEKYYFFFSYAHANQKNAKWELRGTSGNYLDEFFDDLCRQVNDIAGWEEGDECEAAYRDKEGLRIGELWNPKLGASLRKSQALVCLISPNYLRNKNCGKELAFFYKRYPTSRILPVFWEDSEECMKDISEGLKDFLRRYNFTQEGLPGSYPAVGLSQICRLRTHNERGHEYEQICRAIAKRIIELARTPDSQEADEKSDFSDIESIYSILEQGQTESLISGPSGVNIVYIVGTLSEMQKAGVTRLNAYSERREEWCPFPEVKGVTIKILTKQGIENVGLKNLKNLELPSNLVQFLESASRNNSIVLLVLDRQAYSDSEIARNLNEYALSRFFSNCGLVTAGGSEVSDEEIGQLFDIKGSSSYPNHILNVPTRSDVYVHAVGSVVSRVRRQLMDLGTQQTEISGRSSVPSVYGPSGG